MIMVGIVGSRRRDTQKDYELCERAFLDVVKDVPTIRQHFRIVSGGCPQGGDRFAEMISNKFCLESIVIHWPDKSKLDPVKMKQNPRWAYAEINYARNTLIAQDSDILIAVVAPDRKGGTEDTVKKFLHLHPDRKLILVPFE